MFKKFINSVLWAVCFVFLYVSNVYSYESLLDTSVGARAEYNDNIFLTNKPHDAVSSIIIIPAISGIVKEEYWQADLTAKIKSYSYSDPDLDSNDQFFNLTGRYNAERNIFSLNVNHDFVSSLRSTSTDFGIVGRRVNRKKQSITPQYTRLLTERLALTLLYTYSDVDYLEAENTGFTPYVSETGSASLVYNLSEKDKLTLSAYAVDYKSINDLVTYQLFMSRLGITHEFLETLSTDFLIGVSRRNSTNLTTSSFDFFGQPITVTQETDFSDRGLVLNAGIVKRLERGKIEGRLSRDNTTNSYGGLDQTDRFKLRYDERLSMLWRYDISARYEDITSISSGTRATDRNILFFESKAFYSISKNWDAIASYRYVKRKFKSSGGSSKAPYSNRIYLGLTYNFPSLSTF